MLKDIMIWIQMFLILLLLMENVLSGAGRKAVVYEGAGFLDEV